MFGIFDALLAGVGGYIADRVFEHKIIYTIKVFKE